MNLIDSFGKQPKSWMMAEAISALALVAVIDIITPWQFSWFIFYAVPVFLVALNFPRRVGITFAIVAAVVGWLANFDTVEHRGAGAYAWSGVNRMGGLLIAAACGISIQNFREETRRRVEALEHAQELEREILSAGEREQMRIGQDLHDGVCQTLAALDCAAQCLKMDLETEGSPQVKLAGEIQKRLSAATLEARNLARGIYPVTIQGDGLGLALRELVMMTNTLCQGKIGFESDDEFVVKDSEVALHLYRITQEALSNAMRHANATHVSVRLRRDQQHLTISVMDDGCGSAIQARPDGMGWRTMRYRAKLIGAEIKMESKPAGGTTVRCLLPALTTSVN
ncbi:integral membrane sensor signal transduction histidine kinase [Chthoniobacter flavus Ellin428]|uniref:histidine kinase n=1 Tax=Chthoniobacter flavus Ellin428 TaxID=497964 RepID=B4CWL9_9BACT|nr:sensor histidine kinase [Chthoniobacter flavus]EDY21811.1 integral membrane sensor signal transduction histidine kinase [Chthoniobacter flavus Ellin428]TCO95740.1 signal transduction histidine kinase [Chthoniobacter flavus]